MFKFFKKKKVEITHREEWLDTFEKMITLLRDNAHVAQADCVRQIHGALYRKDVSDFLKKLRGVDMWGGSGAVWEVGYFNSQGEEKEFKKLIIELVQLMKNDKISHGKANSVSHFFRKTSY